MKNALFGVCCQDYLIRLVGALVIIIGFALLINVIFNTVDSWNALKAYPVCMQKLNADLPDYSQLRLSYCQSSFFNITGVQLHEQPLAKTQQAQVLLNSIIKLCFSVAVIFFGMALYRPFPVGRVAQEQRQKVLHHRK